MDTTTAGFAGLRTELNLSDLAARVPCLWGARDCNCDGCRARAALNDADEHLRSGRLVDAYLKAGHADFQMNWAPIREAYEALGRALAEQPDDMAECPRCRCLVADELTVAVQSEPDAPADRLCPTCAQESSLCPQEMMAVWRRIARRAVAA